MKIQRKPRILHFCYDHPDNPWLAGGGARRSWAVNTLLSDFFHIHMICGAFPGAIPQQKPFNVSFTDSATGYKESRIKFILGSRRIDTGPYDLVVEDFSVYAPVFPRLGGKPQITIVHAWYGLKAFKFQGIYGLLALFGEKLLVPARKSVILVSEHLKPLLSPTAKYTVIGQGVDIPSDLVLGKEHVLFLGRLDIRVKGIDTLLKAWSKVPQKLRKKTPLVICGGGEQSSLREMASSLRIQDDIHFLGKIDHHQALAMIASASIVCLPSRSEGFPLVAAEAMALGKPVLASSIPAHRANIQQDITGRLFPPEDASALAKGITDLLSDNGLMSRLSENAKKAGKDWRWEKIAEQQKTFYQEVLALQDHI